MLRHQLPSTNSLFSFEAVARLGSFSRAARELNVTQPAVSRSISNLETHLGYPLFKRHGRWIELTPNGDKLFRATSSAFNIVTGTLRNIENQAQNRDAVRISMSSVAVNFWFIPRMTQFKKEFPSIDLNFQMYSTDEPTSVHNVDLGIRLSNPNDADMHRWPFSDEKIMALCAPSYLKTVGSLDKNRRKSAHTLIEMANSRFTMDEFFHATGLKSPKNPAVIEFSDHPSLMQAAIEGHGVALAWVSDAVSQIVDGQLVPACTQVVKTGRRYHIVASNLKPLHPAVEDIRDWLISEMRHDQREMSAVLKANWNLF